MKRYLGVALGVLTAIGGFVDIGDLATNAQVGARFGMSLGWVVIIGVLGICVYAEMSGRVAAISGRATFDLVRERLGPRMGLLNLVASALGQWVSRNARARVHWPSCSLMATSIMWERFRLWPIDGMRRSTPTSWRCLISQGDLPIRRPIRR